MKRNSDKAEPQASAVSAAVETKLVDTLFDQQSSIIVSQLGAVLMGVLSYAHAGERWMIAWIVATIAISPWRLGLARQYGRRSKTDPLAGWVRRFALLSGLNSMTFGLASSISVLQPDIFTQMIIITGQGAYISGAAVRNNAVPSIAKMQAGIPLGMLAVACLATRNPFYVFYSGLVLVHLLAVVQIIGFLSKKTRDMLVAQEEAGTANALLEGLARTDPLTGAVNRRGFDTIFSREFALAVQNRRPLSLLMIDIDHFKALNDAYGHQGGDECLRAVSRRMFETVCRIGDVVSRYGGEEFAILLPGTDGAGARLLAERVRKAIESMEIRHPTSASGVTTVSIGYATREHTAADDCAALIKRADDALYRAKSTGRNRVVGTDLDKELEHPPLVAAA